MGSHTATGEWKSFEIRMRRRRAERLILRAGVAASESRTDEARALIDEVRMLWPAAPGLADVERRLDEAANPIIDTPGASRRSWRETAAAAVCVACIGIAVAVVWTYAPDALDAGDEPASVEPILPVAPPPLTTTAITEPLPNPVTSAVVPDAVDAPESPAPKPDLSSDSNPPRPTATVNAPRSTGVVNPPRSTATVTPSRSNAARVAPMPPDVPVPTSGTVTAPTPVSAPATPPPQPIPDPPTSASTASSGSSGSSASAAPAAPALSTTAAEIPIDHPAASPAPVDAGPAQDALVRGALAGYAQAYSALDVDAAQRVWPSVDRDALARAFASLASQRISLKDCRIQVAGNAAHATCSGSATWKPKVGIGERTDPRSWTFELEKAAAGWQIVSARVQNR